MFLLLYLFLKKYAVKEEGDIDEQISNSIEKAKNLGLSKNVWLLADSFTCSPDGEIYPDSDSVAKEAGFQFIDSQKSIESYIANVSINENKFKLRVGNQKTLYIQGDTYKYKKIEVLVNEESVLSFQVNEEERYHGGMYD